MHLNLHLGRIAQVVAAHVLVLLAACAGGPPAPDWQANAKGAIDDAVTAHLAGDSRAATRAFERARAEVARTGRPELVARVELMRCAAMVASLQFGPCEGFEKHRGDAAAPERAYADYLAARPLSPDDVAQLPPAHRGVAAALAGSGTATAGLPEIADPLSRLIAVAVAFQAGRADTAAVAQAVDSASAQGWRRPLLGWLRVQQGLAQRAGDAAQVQRLQRRIDLVQPAP
ncbi:MAG TPA: hypothetical protein VGE16_15005 [Albitalea sp.]